MSKLLVSSRRHRHWHSRSSRAHFSSVAQMQSPTIAARRPACSPDRGRARLGVVGVLLGEGRWSRRSFGGRAAGFASPSCGASGIGAGRRWERQAGEHPDGPVPAMWTTPPSTQARRFGPNMPEAFENRQTLSESTMRTFRHSSGLRGSVGKFLAKLVSCPKLLHTLMTRTSRKAPARSVPSKPRETASEYEPTRKL